MADENESVNANNDNASHGKHWKIDFCVIQ